MRIYIRQDDGQKRYIGDFKDGVLKCERRKSDHFHHKYKAWAIDEKVFEKLKENRGLEEVHIWERESGMTYKASVDLFDEHGIVDSYGPYRPQIFLWQGYWTTT